MPIRKSRMNKKPRRDPNAPARKKTPWHSFVADNRAELEKAHPDLSYREILLKLGETWRAGVETTQRRYMKQYEKDQTAYGEKMATYRQDQKNKRQKSSSTNKRTKKNDGSSQSKKGNPQEKMNEDL